MFAETSAYIMSNTAIVALNVCQRLDLLVFCGLAKMVRFWFI